MVQSKRLPSFPVCLFEQNKAQNKQHNTSELQPWSHDLAGQGPHTSLACWQDSREYWWNNTKTVEPCKVPRRGPKWLPCKCPIMMPPWKVLKWKPPTRGVTTAHSRAKKGLGPSYGLVYSAGQGWLSSAWPTLPQIRKTTCFYRRCMPSGI